jgi:GST-like protein
MRPSDTSAAERNAGIFSIIGIVPPESSTMASLDLHGARTGNSLRAAIALAESGLPFRAVPVNLHTGEHRKPAFARLNPLGKVPVLVIDDGDGPWVLTQSAAIMLEAARRAGERLLPTAPRDRALATERLLYFLTDVIAPSHAGFHLSRAGHTGASDAMDALVVERMGTGEVFLHDMAWMGGAQFSLADIAAFTLASFMKEAMDWPAFPAMTQWFDRVSRRPAVRLGLRAFG